MDDLDLVFFALEASFPHLTELQSQLYDWHIHMPAHNLHLSGSSNRLALAYGVLHLLMGEALVHPNRVVLSGDLSLKGEVLPVKYIAQKLAAWKESDLSLAVFSARHLIPERHDIRLISHLTDMASLTVASMQSQRCVIPPQLRRFGYGNACK